MTAEHKEAASKLSAVAIARRFAVEEASPIAALLQRCPTMCGDNLELATKAAAFAALFSYSQVGHPPQYPLKGLEALIGLQQISQALVTIPHLEDTQDRST